MKHLSMWLTVVLLGGLPLAAAALDYGPNRPLLAAENGAPQLPTAQEPAATMGPVTKPDLAEASDDTSDASPAAPSRMTPSATSPAAAAAPRNPGPSANNKPRNQTPPKPVVSPDSATWRSLLPGSIQ